MKSFLRIGGLLMLLCFACGHAQAGWVIKEKTYQENTELDYMPPSFQTLKVQGNKVLVITEDNAEVVMIDLNKDLLRIENKSQGFYLEVKASKAAEEFKTAMVAFYESIFKDYSEEMLEAMGFSRQGVIDEINRQYAEMKVNPPSEVKIERQGAGENIAGYNTDKYAIFVDGEQVQELHLSDKLNVFAEFDFAKFYKIVGEMGYGMGKGFEQHKTYQNLVIKSYPLKAIDMSPYGNMVTEVVEIQKINIPESEFAPSAGLSRISLAEYFESVMNATEVEDDGWDW